MKIKVCYHAEKSYLYEEGRKAGLSDKAASYFMHAGEIEIEFEVNAETGEVEWSEIAGYRGTKDFNNKEQL